MKYSYIIFDFDGTLFDSRIGIVGGVKFALDALAIPHPSEEVLTSFIGPPLHESFQKNFQLSHSDTHLAVQKLREYYDPIGSLQSEAYEGIFDLLQLLKNNNRKLAIATAKPTVFTHKILEANQCTHYFDSIRGSDLKGELFPKEKTIGQVLEDFSFPLPEKCVMIGDTIYDIKGAQAHGLHSIAVDYGYGKTQDLRDASPNFIVKKIEELAPILLA